MLKQIRLARTNIQIIRPDFHFCGQRTLKFNNQPALVDFLQIHVSTPCPLILISISRNDSVSEAYSTVNRMFLCLAFNKFKNNWHDNLSSSTVNTSST